MYASDASSSLLCGYGIVCPLFEQADEDEAPTEMGSRDHSAVCRMSDKPKCTDSMSFIALAISIDAKPKWAR